ncbi:MAG: F0F1 ATP synthase subunit B [bacterium]|nr:F0F1 ATP synthase subunit B [bacterium]
MSELIHNFGIDWRLLVTQAINFFILLFILKKFAYKPILEMLRKRRDGIEAGIRMKKEAEERLRHIAQEREKTLEETRKESLAILAKTETAAKDLRAEMLADAAQKAEGVLNEAKKIIGEEKNKMRDEFFKDAAGLVRLGIEKTLNRMTPEERDAKLIQEALVELKTIR